MFNAWTPSPSSACRRLNSWQAHSTHTKEMHGSPSFALAISWQAPRCNELKWLCQNRLHTKRKSTHLMLSIKMLHTKGFKPAYVHYPDNRTNLRCCITEQDTFAPWTPVQAPTHGSTLHYVLNSGQQGQKGHRSDQTTKKCTSLKGQEAV